MTWKDYIEQAKKEIEASRRAINKTFDEFEERQIDDPWEFIRLKGKLFEKILRSLPEGWLACPYCLKHYVNGSCEECEYGKEFGLCREEGSSYDLFIHGRNLFWEIVYLYWCKPDLLDMTLLVPIILNLLKSVLRRMKKDFGIERVFFCPSKKVIWFLPEESPCEKCQSCPGPKSIDIEEIPDRAHRSESR